MHANNDDIVIKNTRGMHFDNYDIGNKEYIVIMMILVIRNA